MTQGKGGGRKSGGHLVAKESPGGSVRLTYELSKNASSALKKDEARKKGAPILVAHREAGRCAENLNSSLLQARFEEMKTNHMTLLARYAALEGSTILYVNHLKAVIATGQQQRDMFASFLPAQVTPPAFPVVSEPEWYQQMCARQQAANSAALAGATRGVPIDFLA